MTPAMFTVNNEALSGRAYVRRALRRAWTWPLTVDPAFLVIALSFTYIVIVVVSR